MHIEFEARLLNVNVDEFTKKLNKNNATFVGDWVQNRKCYDLKPKKENSWIRLRTNGVTTTLTIKEINSLKVDGTKEIEIEVDSFEKTNELLNKMGYFAYNAQENRRIRYVLDNVEIDIDFWPMIPTYVEFEGKSEEDIIKVCNKLDIDYSTLVTLDVESIYTYYGINLKQTNTLVLESDRK